MSAVSRQGVAVGVFGASGQVGTVMRTLLAERSFPVGSMRYFASARSAGITLPWGDGEIVVEDTATADFSGLQIALFSNGGSASREYGPVSTFLPFTMIVMVPSMSGSGVTAEMPGAGFTMVTVADPLAVGAATEVACTHPIAGAAVAGYPRSWVKFPHPA